MLNTISCGEICIGVPFVAVGTFVFYFRVILSCLVLLAALGTTYDVLFIQMKGNCSSSTEKDLLLGNTMGEKTPLISETDIQAKSLSNPGNEQFLIS